MKTLYTIGYGSRTLFEFRELVWRYNIQYLIDIRSQPYSRIQPDFNQASLDAQMTLAGLRYVFMGHQLGGRPADATCYTQDGKVDYGVYSTKSTYQDGIQRLLNAIEQGLQVAIMCSEGKPEDCHRTKLVGVSLVNLDVDVQHIDQDGKLVSQSEVMEKVMAQINKRSVGQLSLFGDDVTLTSRKSYQKAAETGDEQ